MSHSPTYVGRLDPQFRRFVNVVNVHPTSPTSSFIDDKDAEATTSLASSSCSEKLPEFLAVDAYTEESWPQTQDQPREVSEFFLEFANVLSSGSETSFVTDDKEIATSTTTSRWRESPQNVSNSEQRNRQDRISNDCFREDSVYLSDGCDQSFYDENGINHCLQKRPSVSNKKHDLNRPVSGSFSSDADSERNYTCRSGAEECLKDFRDIEGFSAGKYSQRKENINSVPWLRGQEVISRSPQNSSRKMDDSFDDSYSFDSELCYSPDIIEDDYSSTSSADSSFVCFALVAKQEEEKSKRKIASNDDRRHKKHRSRDSSRRRESYGKESDHGVMACVVSGISGGPAIRVYRDEDSTKSTARLERSDIEDLRKFKETPPHANEMKCDATESNVLKGSQFPHERSKEPGHHGFVFGVFGTPGNPALAEEQSGRDDEKLSSLEKEDSSYDVKDVDAYNGRLPTFPGNDLQSKPSVDNNRIYQRNNDLLAVESDNSNDNLNTEAISEVTGNRSYYRSSTEDELNDNKPSMSSEEIVRSDDRGRWTDEPKPLSYLGREQQMVDVNEDGKDLRTSGNESEPKIRSVTDGEDKEQSNASQVLSTGFIEQKRDVRVNSIIKPAQGRRLRRKRKEDDQHRMEPEKGKLRDKKKLSEETDPSGQQSGRDVQDVKDLFDPDRDVKMSELLLPSDSTDSLDIDSHKKRQDLQTTGDLESRTQISRDKTLLMTGGVQEAISDEYTAVEVKTELLTPVKQTIHESIQASFLNNGKIDAEWKMSPNEEVCPESQRDRTFGTELESYKQRDEQTHAVDITEGLKSNSGDIVMKDDLLDDNCDSDHREIVPKEDNTVFTLENLKETIQPKEKNSGIGQERGTGHGYRYNDVEDRAKDNDRCDPIDYDMNEDFDEHDCSISANTNYFVLDSVSESRENENVLSVALSQGVPTDESVNTAGMWKPDGVIYQDSKVEDTNLEFQKPFDVGCQPIEETSSDQPRVNDIVSQLHKTEDVSLLNGSQQRKFTHEAKRKSREDEKQGTKYSKKIKSLSEESTKGGELRSESVFNRTGKSFSREKSSERCEESLPMVIKIPGSSLDERQPSSKEKYVCTKIERSNAKSSEEDASKERAMESDQSSTMDSTETPKSVETFRPDLSPILITAQAYVLINNGTKNFSSVPELDVNHTTQTTVKYKFDYSSSENSTERFPEESPEVSAKVYRSSLSASPLIKSTGHPDIEDLETSPSTSNVERGRVQRINLNDDNVNAIFGEDDSKLTDFSSKETDQCHSDMLVEEMEKDDLKLKKDDQTGAKMAPTICEVAGIGDEGINGSVAELRDIESLGVSEEMRNVLVNKTRLSDAHEESLDREEMIECLTKLKTDVSKLTDFPSKETDQCHSVTIFEEVEKGDLRLKKKNQTGAKIDPSIYEVAEIPEESLDGSTAVLRDIDSLDVSEEEYNVLVNKTKLSEKSIDREEAIEYFTKQSRAIEVLPDSQRPKKISEILAVSPTIDPCEDMVQTGLSRGETVHPLAERVDTSPSISVECLSFYQQDRDSNDQVTVPEATKAKKEKLCVTEDVCFVALDTSEQSEDGAWDVAELTSSNYHNEAVLFSTKPTFVSNDVSYEGNAFSAESEMDSGEGVSCKMDVTGNFLTSHERTSRYSGVEEVLCTYQEQNELNPSNRISEGSLADSENSTELEIDAESNVWVSIGVPDMDTQMDLGEMTGASSGSFQTRSLRPHMDTLSDHSSLQLANQDGFPLASKTLNNDYNADVPDWMPCDQSTHCGCLQSYLLQRSQEKENNRKQEPVAFAAALQELDIHPNVQDAEDSETFGTVKKIGYHAIASVKEVFDQQCQVELLKECAPPEYKTKESQTSFSYTLNKECQTNKPVEVEFLTEALQQRSVECQTQLLPNFYASCGVQVGCLEFSSQDEVVETEYAVVKNSEGDRDIQLRWDKKCQTFPDYGLILTYPKQCQTVHLSEDPSRFPVDHSDTTLNGTEASHNVFFENKECQTSENYLFPFTSNESASKEVGSAHFVCLANKECQTSHDVLLVTSSAQCNILPSHDGEQESTATGIEAPGLPSCDDKECQTLLDNDLLIATSKHCQTSPWSYASDEIPMDYTNAGRESGTLYYSKECQTLPGRSPPLTSSQKCQTEAEFVSGVPDATSGLQTHQIVAYNSKECQTTSDPMNDHDRPSLELFETNEVEFTAQSTQTEDTVERDTPTCDNKGSQTMLDHDLFLSSSKVCQTTKLVHDVRCENRESQTLPDGEIFLISSKECQTIPYYFDDLHSKPPDDVLKGSEDMDSISNDVYAGEYCDTSISPQMISRHRPATYGKSPEATEESSFGFQSELCQTNIELDSKLVVSEKGCQAMLCNCGNCTEESNFERVSSDPQKGAAMRVSEGMQKEQASLIKQLDMLRDMNQKLRDDKDAIEAAHEAKKTKVSRQGSQMSKYVKRRRAPAPEDTWGNQGSVESFSGEEVDGPNNRRSVTLHDSIQEEAEFDGDPTLELIPDEKLQEDERPAWAKKILSCVQPKEIAQEEEVEEEEEEDQMKTSDEELEEDVFRKRKAELISGAVPNRLGGGGENESELSYSEEFSGETGSETDDRPNSPRAAPVGKDNEMCRTGSQDMSEAGVSAISEPSTPERVFKVVFVGDSGVGKSSFIHRFCHDAWKPSFTATIGVDFQIKTMCLDGRCIALQLWDTAGQERFRSITKQYFRKADGVIVFYDVTMETSFLNIKNWMISVEEGTDDGTAIMIVGNKTDLVQEDSERAVKSQDGKKLAEEYKALYTETSAKTGYNIQESMAEFSKMLQVREDELMQSVLNLVQEQPKKNKCCK